MRISDWSSDVCSSDLVRPHWRRRWQTPSYHWPNPPSGDSKRPAAGLPGWLIRRFCPSFKSMTQKNYYITTPIYYVNDKPHIGHRSEEHTSELQSLMRISYAVFCLKKKKKTTTEQE